MRRPARRLARAATKSTAATLAGLAGLHVAWGCGSSVPFTDRRSLARAVAGTAEPPPARECFAVAGLLATAAALVADVGPLGTGWRRLGTIGVTVVLAARGALGLARRTGAIVPWTPSEEFVALDRRYYGPLCLALAVGSAASIRA